MGHLESRNRIPFFSLLEGNYPGTLRDGGAEGRLERRRRRREVRGTWRSSYKVVVGGTQQERISAAFPPSNKESVWPDA